ncbi:MAG: hypothetical protein ACREEZ_15100 [Stellaceae bacterium]
MQGIEGFVSVWPSSRHLLKADDAARAQKPVAGARDSVQVAQVYYHPPYSYPHYDHHPYHHYHHSDYRRSYNYHHRHDHHHHNAVSGIPGVGGVVVGGRQWSDRNAWFPDVS